MINWNVVNWKALIRQITIWVAMELLLDIAGLSQLATYSEFLENQLAATIAGSSALVTQPSPQGWGMGMQSLI